MARPRSDADRIFGAIIANGLDCWLYHKCGALAATGAMLETEAIIKALIDWVDSQPDVLTLLLFGSYATGLTAERSDVDVAILFQTGRCPTGLQRLDLQQELADTVGRDVDLVLLNNADPIIATQVLQYGKLLINRDEHTWNRYVIRIMTAYVELKELRGPIEQTLGKRKFYGR